ncbi:PilN domain-containing protein [Legionella sp. CNM-4043-24]|uniref:PilN domain-containing protein n=1 Tax=Legionella sp. CNM-4043-24 TaxID=3421646 RepID=UPI00403B33FA
MTDINLLPWREIKREKDRQAFTILIASAAAMGFLIAFVFNYYSVSLVEQQAARNQRLQDEITIFDNQIVSIKKLKALRNNLIARMKVAQSLQSRRALTIHLFDELIKILPDGVYFTSVKRVGNLVTVNGYSESNSNVAILMRNIETNTWIQEPALTEIKMDEQANQANGGGAAKTEGSTERSPTFILSFILKPKLHMLPVQKAAP